MPEPGHERIPVVVTGVGGGGFGEQILKALRLAETPYEIIGTDATPVSRGFSETDHQYVVPAATEPRYTEALIAVCAKHEAKAVFVGSEPELRTVSRDRSRFADAGVFLPINPTDVIDTCLDKERTMRFLSERGFRVPRTLRIDAESDLDAVPFLPAVLKPYVAGGGSADVTIAQNTDELRSFARYLLANGRRAIAQEYVGTPHQEYTVGVLTSLDGDLLGSIAVRRFITSGLGSRLKVPNRTTRADLGSTLVISSGISQGEIGAFPDVTGPCESIARALGSRGPLNIQCRVVDGQVVVFEINPRFSGTTSLRAMVGYNEPDLLVRRHVLGQSVATPIRYRPGVILRGLTESLVRESDVPRALDLC